MLASARGRYRLRLSARVDDKHRPLHYSINAPRAQPLPRRRTGQRAAHRDAAACAKLSAFLDESEAEEQRRKAAVTWRELGGQ